MTITPKNSTTVTINGLDYLLSALTVSLIGQERLHVLVTATQVEVVPNSHWSNLNNGANNGARFATQAEFLTAMATAFNVNATGLKKGAAVPNTATAPSVAYVQAEAVSTLTELRALKTSLVNAGVISA